MHKNNLRRALLQSLYDGLATKNSRYYYYLGKTRAWDNETVPDTPTDLVDYEREVRNDIVITKQLSSNDLSFIVTRYDWATGTVYDMWDDTVSMEGLMFYVVTDDFNVYKCIDNNNSATSTEKPIGNDSTSQTYSDGYIWKFMYNIAPAFRNKFMTSTLMPVMNFYGNQFYPNGGIESVTVINGGSGYTTATAAVTGNGVQASLTPIIESGQMTGCTVNDPGYGYTYAKITITGDGTGADIVPNFTGDTVNTLQENIELLAINGSIDAIVVTAGGTGYTTATVAITGDGTGATATATIVSGVITKITMTDVGSGYTWATVAITGDGTGATARAITSPVGGHGSNAITELCASDLMFVSTLFLEKNQGMDITSEFRQTGIIKNLEIYGSKIRSRLSTGYSCFKITTLSAIDPLKFPKNSIVTMVSTQKRFLVVEVTTTDILLQPLDGQAALNGASYINAALDQFVSKVVVDPTINISSGELMTVENRVAFSVSPDEALIFRTIIEL